MNIHPLCHGHSWDSFFRQILGKTCYERCGHVHRAIWNKIRWNRKQVWNREIVMNDRVFHQKKLLICCRGFVFTTNWWFSVFFSRFLSLILKVKIERRRNQPWDCLISKLKRKTLFYFYWSTECFKFLLWIYVQSLSVETRRNFDIEELKLRKSIKFEEAKDFPRHPLIKSNSRFEMSTFTLQQI